MFYGITIMMYYDDHNPPHFYAKYGEDRVSLEINSLKILEGNLPGRALGMVVEWALLHKLELLNEWENASCGKTLNKINPL